MHPLIKIIVFIVTAGFVVRASTPVLSFIFALLLGVSLSATLRPGIRMFQSLWRLKWLWISLLFIYGWFTPGGDISVADHAYYPTEAGLIQGLLRIASLMLLLWLAHLVWRTTERGALIAGIHQFLFPLSWFGLDRQRLAIRLYLTFEQLEPLRTELKDVATGERPDHRLVKYCTYVLETPAPASRYVNMLVLAAPAWWLWSVPLITALILVWVERSL